MCFTQTNCFPLSFFGSVRSEGESGDSQSQGRSAGEDAGGEGAGGSAPRPGSQRRGVAENSTGRSGKVSKSCCFVRLSNPQCANNIFKLCLDIGKSSVKIYHI